MPDVHAVLSASGSHRWMNCPPSAVLESELPDYSSPAAAEGTAAHALAEHKLLKALKRRSRRPTSDFQDDEMEALTDDYVAFVMEQVEAAKTTCPDVSVMVEQRLDFSYLVPEGFGTGDAVIVAEPRLHVIDLKYGTGVLVSPVRNSQLMLYGLGALNAFAPLYDIEEVSLTIFQPRRANVETWTIPVAELNEWAETELKPKALLAAKGEGDFHAGSWCQFCKLSATCRERAEANMALARFEFAKPPLLTDEEIGQVLQAIPELTRWASEVEKHALAQALKGKRYEGFKLVAGRSIRKYTDEGEVVKACEKAGYTDIFDQKLIGITAMEKLMGRSDFNKILGGLVVKPEGKPTLVTQADKRPEVFIETAKEEFSPINGETEKNDK